MHKISIIVPVYNSEQYIEKTINSLVSQDFEDYEIVLVNDGSTDDSIKIARRVLEDSEVDYKILSQENWGLSAARNTGIKAADGQYLCFVDSDDCISNNHLSSLYKAVEETNCELSVCDYEITHENNRNGTKVDKVQIEKKKNIDVIKFAVKRKPAIIVCGFLLSRKFIDENNLYFNDELNFGEDSDYIWKTLFLADDIGLTNAPTYKYLTRQGSIMKTISTSLANTYLKEFGKTISFLKNKCTQFNKELTVVYYREILGFLHAYSRCTEEDDFVKMASNINIPEMYTTLKRFPDIRVKVACTVIRISPKLFYTFLNK